MPIFCFKYDLNSFYVPHPELVIDIKQAAVKSVTGLIPGTKNEVLKLFVFGKLKQIFIIVGWYRFVFQLYW